MVKLFLDFFWSNIARHRSKCHGKLKKVREPKHRFLLLRPLGYWEAIQCGYPNKYGEYSSLQ